MTEYKFITVNELILRMWRHDIIRDARGQLFPTPRWEDIAQLIAVQRVFTMELDRRDSDYLMRHFRPSIHGVPLFKLDVKEGDPRAVATWKSLGGLGLCYINITPYVTLNDDGPVRDDEPSYIYMPLKLVDEP